MHACDGLMPEGASLRQQTSPFEVLANLLANLFPDGLLGVV